MSEVSFPFALNPLNGLRSIDGELVDPEPPVADTPSVAFIVEADKDNIVIGFDGYGENTASFRQGRPIHIEYYHGKLMLRVWGDINQEDPTHTIDLSGALESNRKES